MHPLAVAIAEFHRGAEPRRDHGGRAGMTWVATGNADGFARFGEALLNQGTCQQLTADTLREIERHAALLEIRRAGGLVRQCHGDLHLRNIVLLDGRPTLVDAIEFNDEIGCTDVLYDLAFLLMDLWRRQLPRHANAVWNGYLAETGDHSGISLMPLFLSCRAAVRAKTSVTAARLQSDATASGELVRAAQDYLTKALQFLRRPPASIVAIGGFSGTGKSTLARALAAAVGPPPGAIVLRSDELRKRLCGVSTFKRLEPEHYSAESSHRVYAALTAQAAAIVRSGYSAIVDAVFARPDDRTALERAAAAAGVPFFGSWLQAPESILVKRLRSRALDASDADAGVLHIQEAQSAGQISWQRLGASAGADAVLARAASHLAVATSAT